ncbi:LysR family transcriptional regulator [Devosia sp. CAU 1758]
MDRLASMQAFVRVVDAGSLTAAAESLGISAQMVGKHLRFLEERLDVRLLERTTRRQNLTAIGRAYYAQCRIVLAEADAAEALAERERDEPRGRLRVTMPALLGRRCVAPILVDLAQQHAGLELVLSLTDQFIDLEDGFDLAVRSFAVRNDGLENRAGLSTRMLARQEMVVCASPICLAQRGHPAGLPDLANHEGIIYVRGGQVRPWRFPLAGAVQTITPPFRLAFDDLDAIADAAQAGMGLAWLPRWLVADAFGDGRLIWVMEDQQGLSYESYAVWRRTPHIAPKLRLAIDALAAQLPLRFDAQQHSQDARSR